MAGDIRISKMLFPDACWNQDIISGALFLYFHKETLTFPLHSSVSTFLTGADPFEFFTLVDERAPPWRDKFSAFAAMLGQYRSSLQRTSDIILPLRGKSYRTILLSYPRNTIAWEAAEDLIASSALRFSEITKLIDPFSAADELFSHIFFERFLELYGPAADPTSLDVMSVTSRSEPRRVDWSHLYEYVDHVFGNNNLEQLLTVTYMFRINFVKYLPSP
jgi:hypothetical protein